MAFCSRIINQIGRAQQGPLIPPCPRSPHSLPLHTLPWLTITCPPLPPATLSHSLTAAWFIETMSNMTTSHCLRGAGKIYAPHAPLTLHPNLWVFVEFFSFFFLLRINTINLCFVKLNTRHIFHYENEEKREKNRRINMCFLRGFRNWYSQQSRAPPSVASVASLNTFLAASLSLSLYISLALIRPLLRYDLCIYCQLIVKNIWNISIEIRQEIFLSIEFASCCGQRRSTVIIGK